jgi:hypothetical protein
MTTSPSDRFEHGETVWEAFAYITNDQRPCYRIRRATFERPQPGYELLHYDDGRVDHYWQTTDQRVFRHHVEAVAHCQGIFARLRRDLENAIDEVMALEDDHPAGPGRSGITTAGTAPPEVAK